MIQRYTKVDFSKNLINLLNGVYNVSNDNYDTENKSIVIQLSGEGNHKLKVKLVDKAGLEYNIPETPVIYIGTFFGKWWSYFLIGALTIAIIITLIVVLIVRARRNN